MRSHGMVNFLAQACFACSAKVASSVGDSRGGIQAAGGIVTKAWHACDKGRGSISAMFMTNRTRRSGWPLCPGICAGMLVVLLSGLVAGCIVIPLPAEVNVAQSGDVQAPSSGIALSVLFARDFSTETSRSLGEEMVECVTHGLAKAAPEVRLVSEEEFHRAVFGVKPGEVFLQADTIATLLARPDIVQRVRESGLTHFILVAGATKTYPVRPGESMRSTRLTAAIFELASGRVGEVLASAAGSQGGVVVGGGPGGAILIVWFRLTESASCEALGAEVARAISGGPRDETQ